MSDEPQQGISFSLYVDPHTKKTFVADVAKTVKDAETGAAPAMKKMQLSLGSLFTGPSLLRLAAGAYALRRIGMAADEPSEKLKAFGGEIHELSGTIGSELQAAAGGLGMAMVPAIKLFVDLGGGVHGATVAGAALLFLLPKINVALKAIGLTSGPFIAVLTVGMLAAGAAAGVYGEKAAKAERRNREFADSLEGMPLEEVQIALRGSEEELNRLEIALNEATQADARMVAGLGNSIDTETLRTRRLRESTNEQREHNRILKERIERERELAALGQLPVPGKPEETTGEMIARLNTEIALKRTTLSQAREEIQLRQKRNEADLRAVQAGEFEVLNLKTGEKRNLLLGEERARLEEIAAARATAGRDEENTIKKTGLIREAQAKYEREIAGLSLQISKRMQAENQAGLQSQVDLNGRITQEHEKQTSESRNRQILTAQILDMIREQGPLMEKLAVDEQLMTLLASGRKDDEIQVLELRKKQAELGQQLLNNEEQRRNAAADVADETLKQQQDFNKMLESQAFAAKAMEVSLMRLAAEDENQFRTKRIAQIKEELYLQDTSTESLREAYAVIQQLKISFPEMGAEQEKTFNELIGLLQQAKDKAREIPEEIKFMVSGLETATRRGSLALVQLFTRGKVDAKRFAEDMISIFEQMLAEMMGKAVFRTLLEMMMMIFNPSAALGGAAGGRVGDLIAPLGGSLAGWHGSTLPNFPTPRSGGSYVNVRLTGLERKFDQLGERIEAAIGQPLRVTGFELRGSTIKGSLARETQAAKVRKLG